MAIKNLIRSLVCGISALSLASVALAQEVNLARNEKQTSQAIAALLLADIYKKAGLVLKVQPMPGARANASALAGDTDGEVARIQAYATKNSTLVKVEPGYYYLTTGAFAKAEKGISISSKDNLKKYKVGIVRGVAHAEAATDGLSGVQVAGDTDQLYKLLDSGRIDVAIDEAINGPIVAKKLGLKDIKLVGEIAKLDLFNILTPGKKELAPKISAAIKSMKETGELSKLIKQYEGSDIAP